MLFLASALAASPLDPWIPYLEQKHPEWACVREPDTTLCQWPGMFLLEATPEGGRFVLSLRVDQAGEVALPGGRGAWPEAVEGEEPVVVLDRGGVPTAFLKKGIYTLKGRYRWTAMPQGLAMPESIGLVRLVINGQEIEKPRIDAGALRLGTGDSPGESRLELDVLRKIQDGVPAVVQTRLVLRASGAAREVDFGAVLLPNTRAVSLTSELPARVGPGGELVVQLKPGSWTVQVDAIYSGPLASLNAPSLPAPWPDAEFWVFQADEQVRAVTLSGPPGVDPARTPLSEDWKGLPTFRVEPASTLSFAELRRGQPQPPPNRLSLSRELWLDFDGNALTARDFFTGELNQDWRLDLQAPWVLGHVAENTEDQVITLGKDGSRGVELRNQEIRMQAESRAEGMGSLLGSTRFSAVGWDTATESLSATLHLPPGWLFIGASGVDHAASSLLERWTLVDAIVTGLIGLACARAGGP